MTMTQADRDLNPDLGQAQKVAVWMFCSYSYFNACVKCDFVCFVKTIDILKYDICAPSQTSSYVISALKVLDHGYGSVQ